MNIKSPTQIVILMAAYNAEKFISEQIDSVLNQSNQNWTLYIRNDGSKDSTQSIIDSYTAQYPNKIIQIDKNGANLGCNGNFYRLLDVIEADYYMFCDADDVWLPEKIQILFKQIITAEEIYHHTPILVHGDMIVCNEDLSILHPSLWEYLNLKPNHITSFYKILVKPIIGGSTSIFNHYAKKYIFPVPSDPRIMYDHWIGLSVAKYGKIICVNRPLKLYRQHSGQVCGLDALNIKENFVSRILNRINNTHRNVLLFKSIGIPKWKFLIYKIIYSIRY